jgi:prepilin peptidase CpaA
MAIPPSRRIFPDTHEVTRLSMSHNWLSLLTSGLMLCSAVLLLLASLHDLVARTVPNWVAAALAVLGIGLRAAAGSLLAGICAGLIVFVLAAICWRRGWMGGGDVKLVAAAAIVVPPSLVVSFIAAVAICGGVLAVIYLIAGRLVAAPRTARPRTLIARALRVERWRIHRGGPLPYACAIAAGGLFILL